MNQREETAVAKIAVFGMGYVGCVTAACLGRDGHTVVGVDVDPDKVAEVNAGQAPITEPGLADLVREQVAAGRLAATRDLDRAIRDTDIALVCVGTPSAADGSVNTRAVEQVVAGIGRALAGSRAAYTVVVRSTLPPGLLEERLAPRLAEAAGRELGDDLWICNNPEFLREATAIRDYYDPPFVLVGADDSAAAERVLELYDRVAAEKLVTDTRTASLVKYACNAFHAVKVAFANEVGAVARSFGADGHAVMDLVCKDRKLNVSRAYLRPGFAFGGSCLPKDVRALTRHAERDGVSLPLLQSVLPANDAQVRRGLTLVQQLGKRKVGLAGLSFKAHTDDLRESPLVVLAEALVGRGYDVKIYDPNVQVSRLRGRNLAYIDRHLPHLAALLVGTLAELTDHADLLVLGTDVANEVDLPAFAGEVIDLRRDLARPATADEAEPVLAGTGPWL
jgi:GDP-mannose 6-dehydrogenase